MEKKYFLNLLILCVTLVQGISSLSKGNVEESLDLHNRRKRFTNPEHSRQLPVQLSQVPYIVNILRNNYSVCAGTILKVDVVITSASCKIKPKKHFIFSNSEQRDNGTRHEIKIVIPHKDYDDSTLDYDIALLKIDPPINICNSRNRPIDLCDVRPTGEDVFGRVSGWGCIAVSIWHNIVYPPELRSLKIRIITNQLCGEVFGRSITFNDTTVCTLHDNKDIRACDGDGGSPLVVNGKLLGVLSFPPDRYRTWEPEVYVNLAEPSIKNWVLDTTTRLQRRRC